MPKKFVLKNKQVKRYFKRNKQWLLGVAAIVIVFFVGLLYASANGHLAELGLMLKGQVAGETTTTPYFPGYANMDVRTTALGSIKVKFGTANPLTCATACNTQSVKVGDEVVLTVTHPFGSFLGWESAQEEFQLCECADKTSQECKFTVSDLAELHQNVNRSLTAISCVAKFDDTVSIKVANKLINPLDKQDVTFGTITGGGSNIVGNTLGCSRTVKGTSDTGVCNVVSKGLVDHSVNLVAQPSAGHEFVGWKAGKGGTVPCADPASPTCFFVPSAKNVDVVAEYKDPRDIPVRVSASYLPPAGADSSEAYFTDSTVSAMIGQFAGICTMEKPCLTWVAKGTGVRLTPNQVSRSSFLGWRKYRNYLDPKDVPIGDCPCASTATDGKYYMRMVNPVCTFVVEQGKKYDCQGEFKPINKFNIPPPDTSPPPLYATPDLDPSTTPSPSTSSSSAPGTSSMPMPSP